MPGDKETHRIEAFSDGVFAIAITLLILEIKIPNHDAVTIHGLGHELLALWPAYLAFLVSFVTILVIWVHHHWMFTLIRRADHLFLYWNGLLLMLVTIVPFSTGLLAEYLSHPEARIAASLYTGNFLTIALAFHGLWRYASLRGRLLEKSNLSADQCEVARLTNHYQWAPLLYLLVFMLSFLSELLSISACLLLAFAFSLRGWPTPGWR